GRADRNGRPVGTQGRACADGLRAAGEPAEAEGMSGALLLDDLARFVGRFVVLSKAQVDAIALWIVHTWAIASAEVTAYLWVSSPLKRSGKTLLVHDVLALLVRSPLPTVNISDAALFRVVAEQTPTLLFDEIDAIFGAKAREREDLRGLICGG